jgi:hypothetical protein
MDWHIINVDFFILHWKKDEKYTLAVGVPAPKKLHVDNVWIDVLIDLDVYEEGGRIIGFSLTVIFTVRYFIQKWNSLKNFEVYSNHQKRNLISNGQVKFCFSVFKESYRM